jgi:hypothetical protein
LGGRAPRFRIERWAGGERFEDRDRAAEFRIDGIGDGARQLEPDPFRLRALLALQRRQTDAGHQRQRQQVRCDQREQPPTKRHLRQAAYDTS